MQYNISPKAAIIDSNEEALRNIYVSMTILYRFVEEQVKSSGNLDGSRAQAMALVGQSLESVNAYLERTGVWNLKD